jgi:hypothetical protein
MESRVKCVLKLLTSKTSNSPGRREMNLSPASCARTLARLLRIRRRSSARDGARRFLLVRCDRFLQLLRLGVLGRRRIPVVYDLEEENSVEGEASNEAVEDKRIVDFLEGSKDTGEGAKEVVDNLRNTGLACDSLSQNNQELTAKALNWPVEPSLHTVRICGTLLATPSTPAVACNRLSFSASIH